MVDLLHEVWRNPEDDSLDILVVLEEDDKRRLRLCPTGQLIHSYYASSIRDSRQKYWNWAGLCSPEVDWAEPDEVYTEDDLNEQRHYLAFRKVG